MEKKKINKEKKKRNNLPIIMALCAIIGTSCSILALTQDFNLGGLFGDSRSDLVINSETIINCEYKPATTTNVFQAENGDIQVSTDGHVQVPLFYTSLEPVIPGSYEYTSYNTYAFNFAGNISCNITFNSDGYVGFAIETCPNMSNVNRMTNIYIQKDSKGLRAFAMKSEHQNSENLNLDCFTENSAVAYSDYIDSGDIVDVQIYWYLYNGYAAFKVKVNGSFVKWADLIDNGKVADLENSFYEIDGERLISAFTVNKNKFKNPIYLDCYDVQATVKNLTVDILD